MNKNDAVKAEVKYLDSLEDAVAYLQECKEKGQNVYVDFNGHKLYSCDITMDSAYMEVVGMTKAEDDAIREEYSKAQTEQERKDIIAKWGRKIKENKLNDKKQATPAEKKWFNDIDDAVSYLQECKDKGENVYVEFNEHKLYSCDVTLDSAYVSILGITKAEDEELQKEHQKANTPEERKAVISKFTELKEKHQEDMKKLALPAEETNFRDIEDAVKYLQQSNKDGLNVYVDFNGHKLYSCNVTIDSAYMEIAGMTKAEDEAFRDEFSKAQTQEEKQAIISKWNELRRKNLKEKEELPENEVHEDLTQDEESKEDMPLPEDPADAPDIM